MFFITFGYLYGEEYWQYQSQNAELSEYQNRVSQAIQDFSLNDIQENIDTIELFITPNL